MRFNSVSRIKQTTRQGLCASLLIAALALGVNGQAQAALLGLTLNDAPDIAAGLINTNYNYDSNSGNGILTSSGMALELDDGSGPGKTITGGTFDLIANIDDSGLLTGGTLSIGGSISGLATGPTLLTGTLTNFGFESSLPFEFLFEVTGGDLFALFGSGSLTGGVILSGHGFNGAWDENFGGAFGTADVGVVPVPAAVWLFGSALLGLAGYGRRSRRKQQA